MDSVGCVCLLLQDLVQNCVRGEGGDIGGHVLRETTRPVGLVCPSRTSEHGGEGEEKGSARGSVHWSGTLEEPGTLTGDLIPTIRGSGAWLRGVFVFERCV